MHFYHFRNNLQNISAKTTAFMLKINCLELWEGGKYLQTREKTPVFIR